MQDSRVTYRHSLIFRPQRRAELRTQLARNCRSLCCVPSCTAGGPAHFVEAVVQAQRRQLTCDRDAAAKCDTLISLAPTWTTPRPHSSIRTSPTFGTSYTAFKINSREAGRIIEGVRNSTATCLNNIQQTHSRTAKSQSPEGRT